MINEHTPTVIKDNEYGVIAHIVAYMKNNNHFNSMESVLTRFGFVTTRVVLKTF